MYDLQQSLFSDGAATPLQKGNSLSSVLVVSMLKCISEQRMRPLIIDNERLCFFKMNVRLYHLQCGRVICKDCAPVNNTRPIFEMGFREPVRHCKDCYRSPLVKWKTTDG